MKPRLMQSISAGVNCRSAGIKLRFFGSGLIFQSLLVAVFIFTPGLAATDGEDAAGSEGTVFFPPVLAADFFAMRRLCAGSLAASIRVRVCGVVRGSPHPASGHLLPIRCGEGNVFVGRFPGVGSHPPSSDSGATSQHRANFRSVFSALKNGGLFPVRRFEFRPAYSPFLSMILMRSPTRQL